MEKVEKVKKKRKRKMEVELEMVFTNISTSHVVANVLPRGNEPQVPSLG